LAGYGVSPGVNVFSFGSTLQDVMEVRTKRTEKKNVNILENPL
jgi:hypothetical protein